MPTHAMMMRIEEWGRTTLANPLKHTFAVEEERLTIIDENGVIDGQIDGQADFDLGDVISLFISVRKNFEMASM